MKSLLQRLTWCALFIGFSSSATQAQTPNCDATTVSELYACYGGQAEFSEQSQMAISAFIRSEDAIAHGDYALARDAIDSVFARYPIGDNVWWNAWQGVNDANIGSPHGYYGLRMMRDITDYHLDGVATSEIKTANMRVILVGCTEGIQPQTFAELQAGTGTFVTNNIDPELAADDFRVVKQSMSLFIVTYAP